MLVNILLVAFVSLVSGSINIDPDFQNVTCKSAIKLTHRATGFKLHSHKVNYASGSSQQSVTGFPNADDYNSLFLVLAGKDEICFRGAPVACDSVIRLKHAATSKYLHSHLHESPLSHNQEVSAYEGEDTGDNWQVICGKSETHWSREKPVRLQHIDTGVYLTANKKYEFGNPIPGQLEIHGISSTSGDNVWMAQEGLYFSNAY